MLEAAERRRQDNECCAIAEAITQSIEVLGIDDSDDEDVQAIAVIDLVDCASPPDPPMTMKPEVTAEGGAVVIDLVEGDEEQETKTEQGGVVGLHRTTRKRRLSDEDTIDLTADD